MVKFDDFDEFIEVHKKWCEDRGLNPNYGQHHDKRDSEYPVWERTVVNMMKCVKYIARLAKDEREQIRRDGCFEALEILANDLIKDIEDL